MQTGVLFVKRYRSPIRSNDSHRVLKRVFSDWTVRIECSSIEGSNVLLRCRTNPQSPKNIVEQAKISLLNGWLEELVAVQVTIPPSFLEHSTGTHHLEARAFSLHWDPAGMGSGPRGRTAQQKADVSCS